MTDSYTHTVEAASFDLHEELEWYPGVVVSVTETDGQYGRQYELDIDMGDLDTEGNPRYQKAWCNAKVTPGTKLGRWLAGVYGKDAIQPGRQVNVKDLEGKAVDVMFERYQGEYQGAPVERERVKELRAHRGQAQAQAQAPQAETPQAPAQQAPAQQAPPRSFYDAFPEDETPF